MGEVEEVQHLEAEEVAEVVAEGLVAKVQVQVGGEEREGWLLVGVVREGEVMSSADLMRRLPQAAAVKGCLCCHLGERAGLKRKYLAFWVLLGYFWSSCLHLRRV